MIYDKNLSTVIADEKLWLYVPSIWINVFYNVLKNKMERPPRNIKSCQFLWDISCFLYGPAQWVCSNSRNILIAWHQLTEGL